MVCHNSRSPQNDRIYTIGPITLLFNCRPPTRLDEIKNFHVEVQADTVSKGVTLDSVKQPLPPECGLREMKPSGRINLGKGIVQGLS